jgi:hypothetical protein
MLTNRWGGVAQLTLELDFSAGRVGGGGLRPEMEIVAPRSDIALG